MWLWDPANGRIAIFEAKGIQRELDDLERTCDKALQQIDDRMYAGNIKMIMIRSFVMGFHFSKGREGKRNKHSLTRHWQRMEMEVMICHSLRLLQWIIPYWL